MTDKRPVVEAKTEHAPRDKWVEMVGDFLPPTVPMWSSALARVDRTRLAAAPSKDYSGFRFPDPGLILYSHVRRERNLFNWLLVREANLRRVDNESSSSAGVPIGASNEHWRAFLGSEFSSEELEIAASSVNGSSSRVSLTDNAKLRLAAIGIFGRPPLGHNIQAAVWRGFTIPRTTLFEHDHRLVQEIMWDLYEHSFRFDLLALDMLLAPNIWSTSRDTRAALVRSVFPGE